MCSACIPVLLFASAFPLSCSWVLRLAVVLILGLYPTTPGLGWFLLAIADWLLVLLLILFADCTLCSGCSFMRQILSVQLFRGPGLLGIRILRFFSRFHACSTMKPSSRPSGCRSSISTARSTSPRHHGRSLPGAHAPMDSAGWISPVGPPHEPNKARSKAFVALAQLEAAELRLDGQIAQVGERRQRVVWLHNLT